MRFAEYMAPFEGNLRSEAFRLLGRDVDIYEALQEEILAGYDHYRSGRLTKLQEFYKMALSKGTTELAARASPFSPWAADEISKEIEGQLAIDAGCCSGAFTVFYAINHPQTRFVGIDLSHDALVAAKKRAEKHSVTNTSWVCADAMSLDVSFSKADTVIVQNSMYQILPKNSEEKLFLDRLAPFMRKGSKVVFLYYPKLLIIPQYPESHVSQHDMFELERKETNTGFSQASGNYEARTLAVYRKR